jgi:cytochrome c oxidase subunit I
LPAYKAWYAIIPKVIGGKIFSDSLARLSFVLFLLFSIPVGFHHQLVEPGIDAFWKFLQVVLTFMVVIPSLMTAFSLFATFEMYGLSTGAIGLFGWFKTLPWGDARFSVPFIGMAAFIPAGAGGLINASNQMNQVIHNTIWLTGHFHLTPATSVVLTFFGISYWLVPHLTGRVLTKAMNKMAIVQAVAWSVGMGIMSGAMHAEGLLGVPRGSSFSAYGGAQLAIDWIPYQIAQAIGGTILFIGILPVLYIFINLAFFAPKGEEEFPVGEQTEGAKKLLWFLKIGRSGLQSLPLSFLQPILYRSWICSKMVLGLQKGSGCGNKYKKESGTKQKNNCLKANIISIDPDYR